MPEERPAPKEDRVREALRRDGSDDTGFDAGSGPEVDRVTEAGERLGGDEQD